MSVSPGSNLGTFYMCRIITMVAFTSVTYINILSSYWGLLVLYMWY